MTCTLYTEARDPWLMEFAYPGFTGDAELGLARNAAFARVDRVHPNAELLEIRTDEPHMREVWTKRRGAWQQDSTGLH